MLLFNKFNYFLVNKKVDNQWLIIIRAIKFTRKSFKRFSYDAMAYSIFTFLVFHGFKFCILSCYNFYFYFLYVHIVKYDSKSVNKNFYVLSKMDHIAKVIFYVVGVDTLYLAVNLIFLP